MLEQLHGNEALVLGQVVLDRRFPREAGSDDSDEHGSTSQSTRRYQSGQGMLYSEHLLSNVLPVGGGLREMRDVS